MIDETASSFPNNIVAAIEPRLETIDVDVECFLRPLKPTDPNQCIGIFAARWDPNRDSFEMGHVQGEPTLSEYHVFIQTLVKHGEMWKGMAVSSTLARAVRRVLYRDVILRTSLSQMSLTDSFGKESVRRWGIVDQQYLSNDIEGTFVHVSTLDCYFETEMQ